MKNFLLILGMHRSGTSFLARALNLCGTYLGPFDDFVSNEWMPADDNLRGAWENKNILKLTEKTLSDNKGSWHEIPKKIKINEKLGKEISYHCKKLLVHPSLASGFKDPRLVLCFESWKKYLPNNFVVVGIFRDPKKVVNSLKIRNNFSYEKGINLWKIYNEKLLSILDHHSGFLLNTKSFFYFF